MTEASVLSELNREQIQTDYQAGHQMETKWIHHLGTMTVMTVAMVMNVSKNA